MKILVAIASFGRKNDKYLFRMIEEFQGMSHDVDIVVHCNISKPVPPGVDLVVGLPHKDPRSLTFAHKQLFADRLEDYDLFIYSEDDVLIAEKNIKAFLEITEVLALDEIAGFIRSEVAPDGRRFISTVNSHFHWEPDSVRQRGAYTCACFTNEHGACFLLTREQLRRVLATGKFLVPPYEGRYWGMAVTAATDPYAASGNTKLLPVSHLEDFILPHLPNRYLGQNGMGIAAEEFYKQIEALLKIQQTELKDWRLFPTVTKAPNQRWSKKYFEPRRDDVTELVPSDAKTVLSVGCGWGETEGELVRRGMKVTAMPLDAVIAASAEMRGVQVLCKGFEEAQAALAGRTFDCVLLLEVLHLAPEPERVLQLCAQRLSPGGTLIVSSPNFSALPVLKLRWADRRFRRLGDYGQSGVHPLSAIELRRRLEECGIMVEQAVYPASGKRKRGMLARLPRRLVAHTLVLAGKSLRRAGALPREGDGALRRPEETASEVVR